MPTNPTKYNIPKFSAEFSNQKSSNSVQIISVDYSYKSLTITTDDLLEHFNSMPILRTFPAKYESTCPCCHKPIHVGDTVKWDPNRRSAKATHVTCRHSSESTPEKCEEFLRLISPKKKAEWSAKEIERLSQLLEEKNLVIVRLEQSLKTYRESMDKYEEEYRYEKTIRFQAENANTQLTTELSQTKVKLAELEAKVKASGLRFDDSQNSDEDATSVRFSLLELD